MSFLSLYIFFSLFSISIIQPICFNYEMNSIRPSVKIRKQSLMQKKNRKCKWKSNRKRTDHIFIHTIQLYFFYLFEMNPNQLFMSISMFSHFNEIVAMLLLISFIDIRHHNWNIYIYINCKWELISTKLNKNDKWWKHTLCVSSLFSPAVFCLFTVERKKRSIIPR